MSSRKGSSRLKGVPRGFYEMTPERWAFSDGVAEDFAARMRLKFEKGQNEHGGDLWERGGLLGDVLEELIDLVHYVYAVDRKIREDGGAGVGIPPPEDEDK